MFIVVADRAGGGALENSMAKQRLRPRVGAKARAQRDRGVLIGGVMVAALVFVVVVFLLINQINNGGTPVTASTTYSQIPQSVTADGVPVLGNPDAKITIMEFADFSCPHCLEYHSTIQTLIDNYVRPGKARLIIEPETFVGGQFSEMAAQAALCAAKQNRFWEMHDALFQLQETRGYQSFNLDQIKATSDSLGLNTGQLLNCIGSRETVPALQKAHDLGVQLGVTGTPAVLYSTDGKNFTWWKDDKGQPFIPPYVLIAKTIDQYS
jgi:protein-disulfide isomerase